MIVGVVGHIDHGKTSLVRALTGVDTDRLKEEKERGISIELGFAYAPLDDGGVIGYVDAPGHEKLVHTMAAGSCGIDFALLVIAADDGVMPQTREHVHILELFGVTNGVVALTKIDRVDEARLRQAEAEIDAMLQETAFRDAPRFHVNAMAPDDPGLAVLRKHLNDAAARWAAPADERLFRLAIDRVFTLQGHGVIVAGTVFSGAVAIGDTVSVMPVGIPARVRSIHAQNRQADRGYAGERCALNLVGVEKTAISRGDWLAAPRSVTPTTRVDADLHLLRETETLLKTWSPIHVHIGAAHRLAHVVMLERQQLHAGEAARVQLVFDEPICALPGDRFIVRDARAVRTLGGGRVLDPFAPSRKRRSPERLRHLEAIARLIAGQGVAPLLQDARFGVRMSMLSGLTGRAAEAIRLPSDARVIGTGETCFVILREHWLALRERALAALRTFHADAPDEPGPDMGRLRRMAFHDLSPTLWRALVDSLTEERAVLRNGPWLQLPEHSVTLRDGDQTLATKLQAMIADGGVDPPWVRELALAVREPETRVRELLRKCVAQGSLYQVVHDLFFGKRAIDELAAILATQAREHGAVNAARYRDAIGLGRKRTIQILEFFDRIGYTRRVQDVHVLRPDSGWNWKAHAPGGATGLQTQAGASDASG